MAAPKSTEFSPNFVITPAVANALMRIEAVKQSIQRLPITPRVLANLRETARLFSTHYSTMIEGNRLTQEQVAQVIADGQHFPGRERDQDEVKGYYAALDEVERLAKQGETAHRISGATASWLGHECRKDARQGDAISGWAERDSRRRFPGYRLHATRGKGCTRSDEPTRPLDQSEGRASGSDQSRHRALSICNDPSLLRWQRQNGEALDDADPASRGRTISRGSMRLRSTTRGTYRTTTKH